MKLGIVNLIENMNDKTFVHDCTQNVLQPQDSFDEFNPYCLGLRKGPHPF